MIPSPQSMLYPSWPKLFGSMLEDKSLKDGGSLHVDCMGFSGLVLQAFDALSFIALPPLVPCLSG